MNVLLVPAVLLVLLTSGVSEKTPARPSFTDYPVKSIYVGKPAEPLLSKDQRRFRTMIRQGAKSKVEFAGHYTVPAFGCGAGCSAFYIVDSRNGRVYDGFSIVDLPSAWVEQSGNENIFRIEYHRNSRLFQVNGCPNETNCGFYDYVMVEGVGLKLLRKKPLPVKFQ